MDLHIDHLTPIATVTMVALLCGFLFMRLRQPPIVGYIIAGIVLGPTGLALIENSDDVQLLAEFGVIMLLFLIGMELSLRGFKTVYKTALGAAGAQMAMSISACFIMGAFMEWSFEKIMLFGFAMSLSSTAVAIKILEETGDLRKHSGRLTVGVLIAQDLALVPILLAVNAIGTKTALDYTIFLKVFGAVGSLAFLTWFLTRRERIRFPFTEYMEKRKDLVPLAALALCFTMASISGVIGLSTAYGAFIAGLLIGNSSARVFIHEATMPIQSVLLMVFFLSIGLLIDMHFIIDNWMLVTGILLLVTVFKTLMNIAILHLMGEPWERAFLSGVVMGQIGEFSFVLVATGLSLGMIGTDDYRLIISVIALSLMFSPIWLVIVRKIDILADEGLNTFRGLIWRLSKPLGEDQKSKH